MEELRSVEITVHIETNKATYLKTFDNIEDATEYLENILGREGRRF